MSASLRAYNYRVNSSERCLRIVFRYLTPLLMLLSLFPAVSRAQGNEPKLSATRPGERDMALKTTGSGRVLGRRASFRIYEAADGTRSFVWYGTFASNEQAESAIKQWIHAYKLTRKDQAHD